MADDGPNIQPSASSTRRSSDASAVEQSSTSDHPSRNNSLDASSLLPDSGRRRPYLTSNQTDGYGQL
jgi:hypothetical protein